MQLKAGWCGGEEKGPWLRVERRREETNERAESELLDTTLTEFDTTAEQQPELFRAGLMNLWKTNCLEEHASLQVTESRTETRDIFQISWQCILAWYKNNSDYLLTSERLPNQGQTCA